MGLNGLLDLAEARRRILDAVDPTGAEPVPLRRALGRVLASDVTARAPVPGFDSSAMDGFALRARDLARASRATPASLRLVGESRAGSPAQAPVGTGQAIAISTGAMIPDGADAVVRVEETQSWGTEVEVFARCETGQDIRRAGEDIAVGRTVLTAGSRLGPAELGVLSSLGVADPLCARRPRLSLLLSGDELVPATAPLSPGTVHDSNSVTLEGLASRAGADVLPWAAVKDDAAATRTAIADAVLGAEVLVISGGISVGAHDHIRPSLQALGAVEYFWGIALKPGRPVWFGVLGSTPVFGLPGNPVSAVVTFTLLVAPALRAMLGLSPDIARGVAVLDHEYVKPPGRAHALRCVLSEQPDGWHVSPTGAQGSHILTSMLGADALAIIPSATEVVRAGERVEIERIRATAGALL